MTTKKMILTRYVRAKAGVVDMTNRDFNRKQQMLWVFDRSEGTIRFVSIWFSSGCADYVQVQIAVNGEAIAPNDPGEGFDDGFSCDNHRIPVSLNQAIKKTDTIEIKYINTDAGLDHDFSVTIEVEVLVAEGGVFVNPLLEGKRQKTPRGLVEGFPQLALPEGEGFAPAGGL